jgi:hypothetical protein
MNKLAGPQVPVDWVSDGINLTLKNTYALMNKGLDLGEEAITSILAYELVRGINSFHTPPTEIGKYSVRASLVHLLHYHDIDLIGYNSSA